MTQKYTDEKNILILLSLLKKHGIHKAVVSPGTTNIAFVSGMQRDPYFEVYSSVDERSAAYIACGLAAESGEPVILSCTGATASRNYMSGLTEAFYRKLPILAVTSMQAPSKIGHHIPQILDRSSVPNDIVRFSTALPIIKDADDYWDCEIKANKAILELFRHGGGPVHINLPTTYSRNFNVETLPDVRMINRITYNSEYPELPNGRIAIFVGSHKTFTQKETEALDLFCECNNAVVFCDHTSGYKGKYRMLFALAMAQQIDKSSILPDILIHIGEISGDYYSLGINCKQVWRVSEDGEIRDTFKKLRYVFEMSESLFFEHYTKHHQNNSLDNYLQVCKTVLSKVSNKMLDVPFSNIWVASKMSSKLPEGSTIHFGILNSLRSWNFFDISNTITSYSNVGGFGIDGCVSSLIGASLVNKEKLYFGVFGDLAFFYDLNSIGNRCVGSNLRILLINNGKGVEFKNYNHPAARFGDEADLFMAASGHYGDKSRSLVKNYAIDLGFDYLSASNKDEFLNNLEFFTSKNNNSKPIIFEVFTDEENESQALKTIHELDMDSSNQIKNLIKGLVGQKGINLIKSFVSK